MAPSPPDRVDLAGRLAVVTGATSGIGREVARGLVRVGAEVVIGARDPERGEAAKAVVAGGIQGRVHVLPVDLAILRSIRNFAASVTERFDAVHVLVNNAGAWFTDRRESADGIELTFATNVLAPHVLTGLLADSLKAGGRSRVVNVVSDFSGTPDLADLAYRSRSYDGSQAYSQSKGALRMITWAWAERFAGSEVVVNAAAPGFVRTELNRHARGFTATMINLSARLFAVSPQQGADTPLWVATAPELESVTGRYFNARREKESGLRDPVAVAELERLTSDMVRTAG